MDIPLTECLLLSAWICIKETLSWPVPCQDPTGGANDTATTTTTATKTTTPCDFLPPNLPKLPDERQPMFPDDKFDRLPTVYIGLIFVCIVAIPLAVALRICWIKRLRGRQERTITDLRRQHSPVVDDYPPEIYTITFDGIPVDNVYSAPDYYDNPAWCDRATPPPYDPPWCDRATPPPYGQPPEYKQDKEPECI